MICEKCGLWHNCPNDENDVALTEEYLESERIENAK